MNPALQDRFDYLEELRAARTDQWDAWRAVRQRWRDIAFASDRVYDSTTQTWLDDLDIQCDAIMVRIDDLDAAIQRERDAMNSELDKLNKEAALEQRRFRRPRGPWANLINRLLGPLPADVEQINYDPTEFAKPSGQWFLAAVTFLTVMAGVVVIPSVLPFAASSPVSLAAGKDLATPIVVGVMTALLICLGVLHLTQKMSIKRAIYTFALVEEQWFRQGSETWTRKRQLGSCVGFGIAHLANLVVAFATAGMLIIAGAIFMAVYLHEMRTTGDQRRAVIASAKAHAHYNFVALGLITVIIIAYWTALVLPLLT